MSGVEKVTDPGFSSAGFLSQAKGPLAEFYHGLAGEDHDWRVLLASPREDDPEASPPPEPAADADLPESAPYRDWADRVLRDWQAVSRQAIATFRLDEDQRQKAGDVYERRAAQLKIYLWERWSDVAEYRHELWRADRLENDPSTGDLPFHDNRLAQMRSETDARVRAWLAAVEGFEREYLRDLDRILTDQQREQGDVYGLQPAQLKTLDTVVAYWTLGVGACLLLGFFTRLAALAGGVFLLGVIGAQPPWVAGAEPVYYQVVEAAATFTLATMPVGRWAGLDFFIHALWSRCCGGAKTA